MPARTACMSASKGERLLLHRSGWRDAFWRYEMAAESFPAGRKSQAGRPRIGAATNVVGLLGWEIRSGGPPSAIPHAGLMLFPCRTEDRGSDPACGKRGAKPRVKA